MFHLNGGLETSCIHEKTWCGDLIDSDNFTFGVTVPVWAGLHGDASYRNALWTYKSF